MVPQNVGSNTQNKLLPTSPTHNTMNKIVSSRIYKAIKDVKSDLTMLLAINFLLATLGSVSTGSVAQSGPQRTLLALLKNDHTLALVNSVTLKDIAREPVGPDRHEVIASDDGTTAYVSSTVGGSSSRI